MMDRRIFIIETYRRPWLAVLGDGGGVGFYGDSLSRRADRYLLSLCFGRLVNGVGGLRPDGVLQIDSERIDAVRIGDLGPYHWLYRWAFQFEAPVESPLCGLSGERHGSGSLDPTPTKLLTRKMAAIAREATFAELRARLLDPIVAVINREAV